VTGKTVTIDPVTRIEGHARIDINLNEKGDVDDAVFRVVELRGFERFAVGRPVEEMPLITTKICGICPVSHHLASVKAVDNVYGVKPTETATKLRQLMHHGQMVHSHVLHFYALAAPDLIVGPSADPMKRNLFGLIDAVGLELAGQVIKARSIGQQIIKATGAAKIPPYTAVPGGMAKPLTEEQRVELLEKAKWLVDFAETTVEVGMPLFEQYADLVKTLGVVESYHMGLVTKDGVHDVYDGKVRVMDPKGKIVFEFSANDYLEYIAEQPVTHSSLKDVYLKKVGYPQGMYRVNSLPRINVADRMATPRADELLQDFRKAFGRPAQLTMLFHYARIIEIMESAEMAVKLLSDKSITKTDIKAKIEKKPDEGIGVLEAPRGTLYHHYKTDERGIITMANIIVSTGQNHMAMNQGIQQAAKMLIKGGKIDQGLLNTVEMVIRAYDPCLSCATHSLPGQMPLIIDVKDFRGRSVKQVRRS